MKSNQGNKKLFKLGKFVTISQNTGDVVMKAIMEEFDFVCMPLFHPRYKIDKKSVNRKEPIAKPGKCLIKLELCTI